MSASAKAVSGRCRRRQYRSARGMKRRQAGATTPHRGPPGRRCDRIRNYRQDRRAGLEPRSGRRTASLEHGDLWSRSQRVGRSTSKPGPCAAAKRQGWRPRPGPRAAAPPIVVAIEGQAGTSGRPADRGCAGCCRRSPRAARDGSPPGQGWQRRPGGPKARAADPAPALPMPMIPPVAPHRAPVNLPQQRSRWPLHRIAPNQNGGRNPATVMRANAADRTLDPSGRISWRCAATAPLRARLTGTYRRCRRSGGTQWSGRWGGCRVGARNETGWLDVRIAKVSGSTKGRPMGSRTARRRRDLGCARWRARRQRALRWRAARAFGTSGRPASP